MVNPTIYLGQASCLVGEEIETLSNLIGFQLLSNPIPALHIKKDLNFPSSSFESKACDRLYLEKCSHDLLDFNEHCSSCNHNQEAIVDNTRLLFESYENICNVAVLSDIYSHFGYTTSKFLLNYIRDENPHVSIMSGLIKPYKNIISGSEAYLSLLSITNSLEFADSVILRGFDDLYISNNIISSDTTNNSNHGETNIASSLSLNDVNRMLACDLYLALNPTNNFSLWPHNVCSYHSGKLFDIRSSLYRLLSITNKWNKKNKVISKKTIEYNPMRVMSTNLHNLHNCYNNKFTEPLFNYYNKYQSYNNDKRELSSIIISASSYNHFYIDRKNGIYNNDKVIKENDIENLNALLNWATPNIGWEKPNIVNNSNDLPSNYSHSLNLSKLSLKSVASITNSNKNGNNNSNDNSENYLDFISAISFESPYAKQDVLNIINTSQNLLNVGAYTHL